jgi:hypothetical protein
MGYVKQQGGTMGYVKPTVVDYGSLRDNTFTTPGGAMKGCTEDCHQDMFMEPSGSGMSP